MKRKKGRKKGREERTWQIMSPWLFNVYMEAVMKQVKMEMGVRFQEKGREWRLTLHLHTDDLVL